MLNVCIQFGSSVKVGLKSTQILTNLIFTLKSEEDIKNIKYLHFGCRADVDNINEKVEKSNGNNKII